MRVKVEIRIGCERKLDMVIGRGLVDLNVVVEGVVGVIIVWEVELDVGIDKFCD